MVEETIFRLKTQKKWQLSSKQWRVTTRNSPGDKPRTALCEATEASFSVILEEHSDHQRPIPAVDCLLGQVHIHRKLGVEFQTSKGLQVSGKTWLRQSVRSFYPRPPDSTGLSAPILACFGLFLLEHILL